ncbi:heavy-metal-associated domain-containing protein [Novosphingobium sp. FSY-8]|uniref:Heavy-metal-associated domain-containing protein n=1 Tax=Novosphingobium ovatum TaxID=1908523 RepID=A0ABW9XAQ9_9SPHN|nr:heavy-metal-associated domain-containing protein [Novosphingobium ovatum]
MAAFGGARLAAQIEGERGIAPVVASGDIEIGGIEVNATGRTAQEARANGYREAYKLAWDKAHGPALDAATIEALVSAVVVEQEQIGPHRYKARLTVVFDRGKAAQFISGGGSFVSRSAPMLLIPVLYSGGVGQVYEVRGDWQKVWAEFRTGASAIDYVRPTGSGSDSLLLTAGQPGRRSRVWLRGLLDQFGASDVLVAAARLERQWPGGPVKGTFTGRFGADNVLLGSFTLTAPDEAGVPAMLGQALAKMDQLFTDALNRGALRADPTLSLAQPDMDPGLARLIALGRAAEAADVAAISAQALDTAEDTSVSGGTPSPVATPSPEPKAAAKASPSAAAPQAVTVQFASPDARAVDQALAAVRAAPGVDSAGTTSIAIGGTSVMRATVSGSLEAVAAALRSRGWQVSVSGTTLRIKR